MRVRSMIGIGTVTLAIAGPHGTSANVAPTGAYTRTTPIVVAPYHGLEPNLVLTYNSLFGNGPLGMGWAIGGLSEIRRMSLWRGSAQFDDTDQFSLDGNDLLACADLGGTLAQRASCKYPFAPHLRSYTARTETFERIAFDPFPAGGVWTVWDRFGTRRTYRPSPDGNWPLATVEDVLGNRVEYFYRPSAGPGTTAQTIDRIAYNGTAIRFHWRGRPDPISASNGRTLLTLGERLVAIEVTAGTRVARVYSLGYSQHPESGASMITGIRHYGTDAQIQADGRATGTANVPITLGYRQRLATPPWRPLRWQGTTAGPGRDTVPRRPVFPGTYEHIRRTLTETTFPFGFAQSELQSGDFDGDGRTDAVLVTPIDLSVADTRLELRLSAASGAHVTTSLPFTPSERWIPGEHQDERKDLLHSFPADVNADGRHDLILMAWRAVDPALRFGSLELLLNVAVSDGRGGFSLKSTVFQNTAWSTFGLGPLAGPQCVAADFTGDGRADFACMTQNETGDQFLGVATARSDETFQIAAPVLFADLPVWPEDMPAPVGTRALTAGDVNGDGLDDLLILDLNPQDISDCVPATPPTCVIRYDLVTGVANGVGFEFVRTATPWIRGWGMRRGRALYAADINGDHRVDAVSIPGSTATRLTLSAIDTAVGLPGGGFTFVNQPVPAALSTQPVNLTMGDADGDGATDLLVATPLDPGGGVNCSTTAGQRPVLSEVMSLGDGTFRFPARWDDCAVSRALSLPWSEMRVSAGGFRSADTNGDGLADFLVAFTRYFEGEHERTLVAIVDDVAKPTGLDVHRWIASELNGDGRSDFVRIIPRESSTQVATLVRRADGTYRQALLGLPWFENPSLQSWRVADVNGDARADLVHLQCIDQTGRPSCDLQIDTFLSRGDGTFSEQPRTTIPGGTADVAYWRPLDLDGDGRSKLVYIGASSNADRGVVVRVLSFLNGWVDFGPAGPFQPPGGPPAAHTVRNTLAWTAGDVDGDGRSDLLYVNTNVTSLNVTALLWRGANSWEQKNASLSYSGLYNWAAFYGAGSEAKWRTFDVNGDGLTDLSRNLRTPNGIVVHTFFSVGNGTWQEVADAPNLSAVAEGAAAAGAQDWHIVDVNMDGRPDLVHLDRSPTDLIVSTLISDGRGRWRGIRQESRDPGNLGNRTRPTWVVADADGDGRSDFVRLDAGMPSDAPELSAVLSQVQAPLLRSYAVGGGSIRITYGPSSLYEPNDPSHGCGLPIGSVQQVVRSLAISDGRSGGTRETTRFGYGCPRWFAGDRIFSGWDDVSFTVPRATNRAATRFHRRYRHTVQCGAQLIDAHHRDDRGDFYATRQILGFNPARDRSDDCLPVYINRLKYEPAAPSNIADNVYTYFTYDEFGNVTQMAEHGSHRETGDERFTSRTFRPNTAAYIVGLPASEQLHAAADASGAVVRLRYFCYDGDQTLTCEQAPSRGQLTQTVEVPEQGTPTRKTDFLYDTVGNLAGVVNANLHGVGYFFDNTYRTFPTFVVDAQGQTQLAIEWDTVLLRPTKATLGNATAMSVEYDEIGRVKRSTLPQGGVVEREYLEWGNPARQRVLERALDGSAGGLWTLHYLDGLGREYRTVKKGARPGETVERLIEYGDASMRPYRVSDWFRPGSTTHPYETFEFDGAGRLIRQRHADGTAVTWRHQGDVLIRIDETQRRRDVVRDAYGRLAGVREYPNGTMAATRFEYDAAGEMRRVVDPLGNVTRFAVDRWGRTTSVDDHNLGLRTYVPDTIGNVLRRTDARNHTVVYTHDALERLKTRTTPDGRVITWNYDEPNAGASRGKLTSILDSFATTCPQSRVQTIVYDAAGQVSRLTKCIEGVTQTLGFDHDQFGRLQTLTYPDGEAVSHGYDAAGRLATLRATPGTGQAPSSYVDDIRYDAAGRVIEVRAGNGVRTRFTYDRQRSLVKTQRARLGNKSLFDITYTYYPNGLPRTFASKSNDVNAAYTYDEAGRLKTVTGGLAETYDYDAGGNLRYRSRRGIYNYPIQGPLGCSPDGVTPRPCRAPQGVETVGSLTYRYDPNGNLSLVTDSATGQTRSIDWGFDHAPSVMSDFDGTVTQFVYDAAGQRVARRINNNVARFFGAYNEQSDAGVLIKHYYAGPIRVATRAGQEARWNHTDRLGSVLALTDAQGAVLTRSRYDAFGQPEAAAPGDRFAGHTREPGSPLYFMGSRIYDSSLGRFLGADPLLPAPFSTQGLNRYSYVYNDPLSFVDPTGNQGLGVNQTYGSSPSPSGSEFRVNLGLSTILPLQTGGSVSATGPGWAAAGGAIPGRPGFGGTDWRSGRYSIPSGPGSITVTPMKGGSARFQRDILEMMKMTQIGQTLSERLIASGVNVEIKEIGEGEMRRRSKSEGLSYRYPAIATTDDVVTSITGRRSIEIRISPEVLSKYMIPAAEGGIRTKPLLDVHSVQEIAAHELGHALYYSEGGNFVGPSVPGAALAGEQLMLELGYAPIDHFEAMSTEIDLYDQYYFVVPALGLGDYPVPTPSLGRLP